jgi:hypothetical protein
MSNLAMKAWPCIIIWIKIAYELIFNNFPADEEFMMNKQRA